MNQRIQELALEAGKYADETQPRGSYTRDGMWLYAYNEKFAELIVAECIEVVKWTPSMFPNDKYVKNIKEHFGVEL